VTGDDGYGGGVRRLLPALAALVAVVAGVVAIVVLTGGDDEPRRPSAARGEALAFVSRGAPAIIAVDTGTPAAGLVLQELVPRLTGGALRARDIGPLLGEEAVVGLLDPRARRAQVSFVAREPNDLATLTQRLRPTGRYRGARLYATGRNAAAVAVRGRAVVAAPDEGAVRRALDVRADPRAHLTPRAFDERLGDLSPSAPVRAVFDARAVLAAQEPGITRTRWGRALRGGAAVLAAADDGLRIPFRLDTAPGLNVADLPFGVGARTPVARGQAPLVLGVRRLDRLIAFLRTSDPRRFADIDRLEDDLPAFLNLDVDDLLAGLRNDATVASRDLRRLVVRTDPRDAGTWRAAIQAGATLSGVLDRLGIDGIEVDEEPGEVYRLRVGGRLVLRAGIYGPTLVATDDPRANIPGTARAPVSPAPAGAAGGLTVRLRGAIARSWLTRTFALPAEAAPLLTRVGDLTGWARAQTDGVRGELRLGVR
jgi:hypothetical protein